MATPIIMLCGNAGAGKDTVGQMIADRHNGICLAQADLMKRMAQTMFGFSNNQLWGPSEERNKPDKRSIDDAISLAWKHQETPDAAVASYFLGWFNEILETLRDPALFTPRYVLQSMGTFGRGLNINFWVTPILSTAQALVTQNRGYSPTEGLFTPKLLVKVDFAIITD